jgi:1,2-diacylglycerol 3-alpha-glucosyltransferase
VSEVIEGNSFQMSVNKRIKVLHISTGGSPISKEKGRSTELGLLYLLDQIVKEDVAVDILDVKVAQKRDSSNITFHEVANLPFSDVGLGHVLRAIIFSFLIIPSLIKFYKGESIDVVHTHSQFPACAAIFVRFLTRRNVPIIHTVHNPHIIMPKSAFDYVLHISEIVVLRLANLVIVETRHGAESISRRLKVSPGRIRQIYSGIDIQSINRTIRSHQEDIRDTINVISVGRICRRKDQMTIVKSAIEVLKSFRNVRFIFVGAVDDISYMKSLSHKIDKEGIHAYIHFTGEISTKELLDYLATSDIFVFSSISETQGLSVLEGMCFGLATISSNLPTVTEMLGENSGVLYFHPGNIQELVSILERLIVDVVLRHQLGNSCRKIALKFSWKETAHKTCEAYRDAVTKAYSNLS